jgi:hypothetical protein
MAHTHKLVDGVRIDLTAEEITALNTADTIENQRIIDTRIAETNAEANAISKKASGKQKLLDLGLSEEEVKALIGI